MKKHVVLTWLSVLTLVASNPVPQLFPNQQYASQQTLFSPSSIPDVYQASQNSPYSQHVMTQNHAPVQKIDGSMINELLKTKILGNPNLQKILDPNTKLYNQNGQEIKRQPNTATSPSVINNYFIVPPEFFSLNNKTKAKSTHTHKNSKISNEKVNLNQTEANFNIFDDVKNKNQKGNNSNKKRKKKKSRNVKSAQIVQDCNGKNLGNTKHSESEMTIFKMIRDQDKLNNKNTIVETELFTDDSQFNNNVQKVDSVQNTNDKRKKKSKKRRKEKETTDKKKKSVSNDVTNVTVSQLQNQYLKNIESPVDNNETTNVPGNGESIKRVKENRKTRNPNAEQAKNEPKEIDKQYQNIAPIPEDILKNFYPFMFTGNNFYSNGNYPFNFEQFYQPFFNVNTKKNKNIKAKNTQNKQNKQENLPNTVEVKLKPIKDDKNTTTIKISKEDKKNLISNTTTSTTTTEKLLDDKNTEKAKSDPVKPNTEYIAATNVKEANDSIKFLKVGESEIETELKAPKREFSAIKTNIEMPPTVIEDLQEYITPELGSEDIVPTMHTNGIINDYYPIFYDDSQYSKDEYHLKDLDDDRYFYTTDRGFEEPLNRDRRKYDMHEDFPRPNLNIKDRINFRRTQKFRERDKLRFNSDEIGYIRRPNHEKVTETKDYKPNSVTKSEYVNDNIQDQFQTPPLLEKVDFITKKVEKGLKSDISSHEAKEPIYKNDVEEIPAINTYFDAKPNQYSKLINLDASVVKNNEISTKTKPRNERIETVFAKTRVVKYGVAKDEEESTSALPLLDKDKEESNSDRHTTYVLAKSLSSNDYFW